MKQKKKRKNKKHLILRNYQLWNKRELSAREDEDYFTEEEDEIFQEELINSEINNVNHNLKDLDGEKKDYKIVVRHENHRTTDYPGELICNGEENENQLLKRKKLSDGEDEHKNNVKNIYFISKNSCEENNNRKRKLEESEDS